MSYKASSVAEAAYILQRCRAANHFWTLTRNLPARPQLDIPRYYKQIREVPTFNADFFARRSNVNSLDETDLLLVSGGLPRLPTIPSMSRAADAPRGRVRRIFPTALNPVSPAQPVTNPDLLHTPSHVPVVPRKDTTTMVAARGTETTMTAARGTDTTSRGTLAPGHGVGIKRGPSLYTGRYMSGDPREVVLTKDVGGFGFAIVGQTQDKELSTRVVYILDIKVGGVAARDGRLQKFDRLLEVNGIDVKNAVSGALFE